LLSPTESDRWVRALFQQAGTLSIVIPAYNEEQRLPHAIQDVGRYLRTHAAEFEIIVADDGSTDGTARTVQQFQRACDRLRLVRLAANQGKGAAVKAGMLAALGNFLLFTDADQSTPIDHLPKLLMPLLKGEHDIAIGSRATHGAEIIQGQAWHRQKLGEVFGLLAKILLVRGFSDSQCGFKCFRREAALAIFPRLTSSSAIFDLEVLLLSARAGFRVAEVPVAWRHDPDSRLGYTFRKSVAIFRELLRLRRHWRVLVPAKADVSLWQPGSPGAVVERAVCCSKS
jgi:dolichyl-phosphate beta-glucosyltransferase